MKLWFVRKYVQFQFECLLSGGEKVDDCFACPAGYWCNETGLSDFTKSACVLGFYCTGGSYNMKLQIYIQLLLVKRLRDC